MEEQPKEGPLLCCAAGLPVARCPVHGACCAGGAGGEVVTLLCLYQGCFACRSPTCVSS